MPSTGSRAAAETPTLLVCPSLEDMEDFVEKEAVQSPQCEDLRMAVM
jgi:hypothetical protein